MIAKLSDKSPGTPTYRQNRMRSRSGLWGSLLVVAMVPLTVLYQLIFASGADTFVHWILAAGALLMALATFDFVKVPRWISWVGALSAVGLATIFLLQGLSHLVPSARLTTFAYGSLAQWPEPNLLRLFLYGWCGALLLWDSHGKTRMIGIVALLCVLVMELYRFAIPYLGGVFPEALRAIYLLPFVWLLLESVKNPETTR